MQHSNMYLVIRTGRCNWAIGHILGITIQSMFLSLSSFIMSILIIGPKLDFSAEWGKIIHTLSISNAAEYYNVLFPIHYETLVSFNPIELMLLQFLMSSLTLNCIGIIMFALSIYLNRLIAVSIVTAMSTMIFFIENIHYLLMVKLGRFVPLNWIRVANYCVHKFGVTIMPSFSFMLVILLLIITILAAIILRKAKYIEFHWSKEE